MVLCLKTRKSRTLPGISKMKNLIIVTGGAGFVGSNLIELLLKKTKYQIISLDNYSSGSKKNHIMNKRAKYIKRHTIEIKKNIGKYKNLSPYAFTKSKNLELLENLKKWFNFKFEIIFFYNVYGPRHIKVGDMATVIGIFEDQYLNKKPLTVVKPGNQTRRFTHIFDTVQVCYEAFKADKCRYYSISNKNSYSILQVAKMFKSKIILLKPRLGERYASALTKISNNNKIIQKFGKLQLKDYVSSFINSH